ncbi:MAG TPA: hypothetical protein VK892_13175 [Pyrinomonadaceae bacterium]|nr:hypothetical protein [Pyrinomonadaceae bacterium]
MDSKKIVIIVLILIIAAFVVFVTWGSLSGEQPKRGDRNDAGKFVKEKKTPPWAKVIKSLFGSLSKKMALRCAKAAPDGADYQCEEMPLNEEIKIPEEPGTSFRTASFILAKGKARIEYNDRTEKADDFDLDEQEFNLPDLELDDPNIGSIVALEKGGSLKITCLENKPCQVKLQ